MGLSVTRCGAGSDRPGGGSAERLAHGEEHATFDGRGADVIWEMSAKASKTKMTGNPVTDSGSQHHGRRRIVKHLALIWMLGLVGSYCLGGENMLSNPAFENSSLTVVGNWQQYTYGTKGGLITVVPDEKLAHSGNVCIRLETEGKGDIGLMQG